MTATQTSAARAIRRRLMRGSLTVLLGMAAGTLLTLVANAILARILPHARLGDYFLAFSMVTIGTTIGQIGLDRAIVRTVSAAIALGQGGRARAAVLRTGALAIGVAGTLAVATVAGLGSLVAHDVYHSPAVAAASGLIGVWIVVNVLLSLTAETFRGLQRFWPATLYSGLAVDILLVAAFGLVWAAGGRPTLRQAIALTVAVTAAALLAGGVRLVRQVRTLGGAGSIRTRELTSVSLPLLGTSLASFMVGTGVDLWVAAHFTSAQDVALYGAASRLVFFVATPLIVISQVVPPIIAELHALGEREQLERALRTVSTLAGMPAGLVLLAFALLGGPIMSAVYGGFFAGGATVLTILSCARLVAVCTGSSGATLMMTGHQRTMMALTVATGVFALVSEILLAPRYGITGIACATCAAQIMQNLLQLAFARIRVGIWTHARFSLEPLQELVRG